MILFGISISITSCMMMGPSHLAGSHHMTTETNGTLGIFDPVCWDQIEKVQDNLILQYEGTTYYFHSSECMDLFKMAPEKYIEGNPKDHSSHEH